VFGSRLLRPFFYLSLLVLFIFGLPISSSAEDTLDQAKVRELLFPYRAGPPQIAGITPRMTIDKSNAQVAKDVLPPELLDRVAAGDLTITVQETTDTPLRAEYVEATVNNVGKTILSPAVLQNYAGGLPFPLLNVQDPDAGRKAAWNYRYRDRGDNVQYWPTNEHRTGTGTLERSETFYIVVMFRPYNPDSQPRREAWDRSGTYSKRYMRVVAPADAEGRQIVSVTHGDDTRLDDQWVYDPRTRRTRKAVYNPYEAPGNGQLLAEDTSGFNGYIHVYEWKYLGEKVVLAPSPIKSSAPTLGGRGGWYPVDPWELRNAIVLEAKSPAFHPLYSRRLLYLDTQTYTNLYTFAYDHSGKHRRTFLQVYFHPEFNPWNNPVWLPQLAAQLSMDYDRDRASLFQTNKVIYNADLNETRWFSVMALMLYGK
jgi:uncharacterized protein DUF1329